MSGTTPMSRRRQAGAGLVALIVPPAGLYLGGVPRRALVVNLVLLLCGVAVFFLVAAGPGLALVGLAWLHAIAVCPLAPGFAGRVASVLGLAGVVIGAVFVLERPPKSQMASQQLVLGGEVFRYNCQACHQLVGPTRASSFAPSLHRVVGRAVASEPYDYSDAMTAHGGIWTADRLMRFLSDPTGAVDGTSMAVGGISPEDAAAVIAYLVSFD